MDPETFILRKEFLEEFYKLKSLSACPICKTENEIIRMLE